MQLWCFWCFSDVKELRSDYKCVAGLCSLRNTLSKASFTCVCVCVRRFHHSLSVPSYCFTFVGAAAADVVVVFICCFNMRRFVLYCFHVALLLNYFFNDFRSWSAFICCFVLGQILLWLYIFYASLRCPMSVCIRIQVHQRKALQSIFSFFFFGFVLFLSSDCESENDWK